MNMDAITLEDCLINYEVNYVRVIINDGHIIEFEEDLTLMPYTPYVLIYRE